ncbi:hypothetical protein [Bradyrhizobium sp. USDA 241]|uniref:hypothetical protein n=1 Tax=Bradyrhizobium sp. USDA 241 TaxID=3377725 RepID=UPI003C713535
MTETTNVLAFRQPSAVDDPLTDIVRAGARDLLARAIESKRYERPTEPRTWCGRPTHRA